MDQDGNAALAGIFSAKEVVAGAFSVKTDDPEKRTMGEETILAGESEKSVLTNAIAATSKIFVTFENDPGARYWIEKTTNPETGEFLGFVLKLSVAAVGDAKFSWWIVESR